MKIKTHITWAGCDHRVKIDWIKCPMCVIEKLELEIERLQARVAQKNTIIESLTESLDDAKYSEPELRSKLERLQARVELLEGKLHDIETWCRAYPETVFIEPTKEQWAEADRVLNEAGGCSLTAISGSNMRHVVKGIGDLAALKETP